MSEADKSRNYAKEFNVLGYAFLIISFLLSALGYAWWTVLIGILGTLVLFYLSRLAEADNKLLKNQLSLTGEQLATMNKKFAPRTLEVHSKDKAAAIFSRIDPKWKTVQLQQAQTNEARAFAAEIGIFLTDQNFAVEKFNPTNVIYIALEGPVFVSIFHSDVQNDLANAFRALGQHFSVYLQPRDAEENEAQVKIHVGPKSS